MRMRPTSSPIVVASRPLCFLALVLSLAFYTNAAFAQTPEWIWGAEPRDKESRFFKKSFELPSAPTRASIALSCDNAADLFLNGQRLLRNSEWSKPNRAEVGNRLKAGTNQLVVIGRNTEGIAGLLVKLDLQFSDGSKKVLVSDATWQTAPNDSNATGIGKLPESGWVAATSLGAVGRDPWGDVLKPQVATPAESIKVASGFKVELLRSSQPGEGSWVSMTIDGKGRLIVSPQGEEPMLRVTLNSEGKIERMETIDLPVRGAMGLLWTPQGLYVNGQGKEGYHLYRLRDTNSDDAYDTVDLIRRWKGGAGEHGAHGIVLGADQKLYTVCGNFVDVPTDLASGSPHKNYADDLVLPRVEDGNGFGAGRKPPGGFVARMNLDGSNCELFASGERNTYVIALNAQGELFGFDSDMEWDWGTPWYRPIRAFHVVSGGDQGFREGSGKWPEYYPDSLPPVVNIGIGSPTGVRFGTGAKFPARYQNAFYMMDWSYGRIVAVHLKEFGASYTGTFENFVQGKPLNVTDLEVGPDGAMYFLTGGRGTQSGLYRVFYSGSDSTAPSAPVSDPAAQSARALRHQIESYHGLAKAGAVDFVWQHLGSQDRWIRYAARIALESQPVSEWQSRALAESNPTAGLTALLGLARVGAKEVQEELLKTLTRWPLDSLDEEHKLLKLRIVEVSIARHGLPSEDLRKMGVEKLSKQFPAKSAALNRELAQLLIALKAPNIVSQTLDLRDQAKTQEEQLLYMVALRKASEPSVWTISDRQRYFAWLNSLAKARLTAAGATDPSLADDFQFRRSEHPEAFVQWFRDVGLNANNGASFDGFLRGLRDAAVASLSPSEKSELGNLVLAPAMPRKKPAAVQRSFVKDWKMTDFTPALLNDLAKTPRNFQRGKEAFTAGQCAVCHRFGNAGGAVGPDITAVSSRFSRMDVLSSILEPSKVISEQYENTTFVKKDDEEISGRILEDTDQKLVLLTSPLTGGKTELKKSEIKSRRKSTLSPMPEGLVNSLSQEEILDLLAYIESMGNANHPIYAKK